MAVLKTDYKDDVLNTSVNTQRKYIQTNNADGTISLTDATSYTQEGSTFGAADINATNQEVNTLNENLTAEDNLQFKFGKDGDGNYGYYGADGSLIPFKSGFNYDLEYAGTNTESTTVKITMPDDAHYLIIVLAPYMVTQRIMYVIDTLIKKAGRMVWSNDSLTAVSYAWRMDYDTSQNDIAVSNIGLDYFIGNAYVYGDTYYKLIKIHD